MKKLKYSYYVVYGFPNGTGSIQIKRDKKIKSINDIQEVKEAIEKDCNLKVVILNYILLSR